MELIRPKKVNLSLDLAPLIDVVFQLLVFFMLTATFVNPSIRLKLPKAVTSDTIKTQNIMISLKQNGEIFVNDKATSRRALKTDIKRLLIKDPKRAVHVKGDQDMPYKYFVEVVDTVRQAGARQVNIVHEVK